MTAYPDTIGYGRAGGYPGVDFLNEDKFARFHAENDLWIAIPCSNRKLPHRNSIEKGDVNTNGALVYPAQVIRIQLLGA